MEQHPQHVRAGRGLLARRLRRVLPSVALVCVAGLVMACSGGSSGGDRIIVSAGTTAQVSPSSWSVIHLPDELKQRSGTVYAQIDDSHALAYGGATADNGKPVQRNDAVLVDLTSGEQITSPGPDVSGGLARASAATETGASNVAVVGLQCSSPSEDSQYAGDDAIFDACSPGPLTLAIYDGISGEWAAPSEAPYDYGQAFLPVIVGYIDGHVYIAVSVYNDSGSHDEYVSFDTSNGTWSQVASAPGRFLPCLGEPQVAGLLYDQINDESYTNPRVVVYDASEDAWAVHPVPEMAASGAPFGRSCTENAIVINDYPAPGRANVYYALSLPDAIWTRLHSPASPHNLGASRASAGTTLVRWNVTRGIPVDSTPASLEISAESQWIERAAAPVEQGEAANVGLEPFAHSGTRVLSIDRGTILTADLTQLAKGPNT